MNSKVYKIALSKYADSIAKDLTILKKLELPPFKKINLLCSKLSNEYKNQLTEKIEDKESILYYFTVKSDCSKIHGAVSKLKGLKKNKYKLPLVNLTNQNSKILYVGKTNSNFITRIEQHLGFKSPGTYALHLSQWACKLNLELELNYAKVQLTKENIRFLEQMENVLHSELKPLLGRSGH